MKKILSVIPITILICILLSSVKAYAYDVNYYYDSYVNEYKAAIYVFNSDRSINFVLCVWNDTSVININNGLCNASGLTKNTFSPSNANLLSSGSDKPDSRYVGNYVYDYNVSGCNVVRLSGSVNITGSESFAYFNSRNDYLNPPTPTPTPTPTPVPSWSKTMWNTLQEELGNPAFWFGEWFIDIIDQVFGNEEEPSQGPSRISDSTHIKQVTPALTPSPIPYSTITVPRTDIITGQTVYETNYYYFNPSGTPIVATSPPTNPPAQNDPCGGSDDNYNPVDPYSIPDVSWFTAAEIGDTTYNGIDSVMQGFDSIDTIGSDYSDGMSVVEDATGTLPSSWLLLIGIAAAIPLVAGIISRFLS